MNKITQLSFALAIAMAPFCSGFANTTVQLEGYAPPGKTCSALGLSRSPFGMEVTMPSERAQMAKINSTQYFAFNHPKAVQLNNEGLAGHCGYYANSYPITIDQQPFTLNRLVIMSVYDQFKNVCVKVRAKLYITDSQGNAEPCEISLNQRQ